MIVGDLFSGIGGFSLAAHWMGWRTAWFSEIDPFACRVLAHHWPDVPNLGDITRVDWSGVERVDVLTGGFPCQPHSLAGKRQASNDERDLFSEIIRAVRVLRPRYIVLENVRGLLTSEDGRFFGRVLSELAECGYDAEWRVLSAADVGAPHKRERVWIVAGADVDDAHGGRREQRDARLGQSDVVGAGRVQVGPGVGLGDAKQSRLQGHARHDSETLGPGQIGARAARPVAAPSVPVGWSDAGPVRGHDGTVRLVPQARGTEPAIRVVAHGVPARVAQLRGIGNSIVPACALEIFRDIEARELRAVA